MPDMKPTFTASGNEVLFDNSPYAIETSAALASQRAADLNAGLRRVLAKGLPPGFKPFVKGGGKGKPAAADPKGKGGDAKKANLPPWLKPKQKADDDMEETAAKSVASPMSMPKKKPPMMVNPLPMPPMPK